MNHKVLQKRKLEKGTSVSFQTVLLIFQTLLISSLNAQVISKFDSFKKDVEQEFLKGGAPGLSISIYHNGEFNNLTYGFSDYTKQKKVTISTLFMNASTGKVFTAYAALKLALEGKLDLHKPIKNYITGLDPVIGKLTLEQLLSHTSGLKDRSNDFGPIGISTQIQSTRQLNRLDIFAKPNQVFSYSNVGYNIVGAVLESVSGLSFNKLMKKLVFQPFGMPLTTYRSDQINQNLIAIGHTLHGNGFQQNERMPDNSNERASGMALTTASELNRFLVNLTKVFGEHDSFFFDTIANSSMTGSNWEYGYGLFHSEYCNTSSVWHSGGIPGYSAAFLYVPESDFSVVVLANSTDLNQWNIIFKALEIFLEADCTPSPIPNQTYIPFTNVEIENLVGLYTQGIGPKIELLKLEEGLSIKINNNSSLVLKNNNGKMVIMNNGKPSRIYNIVRDDNGNVQFIQNWVRAYPKIN